MIYKEFVIRFEKNRTYHIGPDKNETGKFEIRDLDPVWSRREKKLFEEQGIKGVKIITFTGGESVGLTDSFTYIINGLLSIQFYINDPEIRPYRIGYKKVN